MIRSPGNWWRAPEQELLRLETARALRWLVSWRGLALVAVQVALPWIAWCTPVPFSTSIVAISPFFFLRLFAIYFLIASTCFFPLILQRYALSRLAEPQSDHLWILPQRRGVIAFSLLMRPLLFAAISGTVYVFLAYVVSHWNPSASRAPEYLRWVVHGIAAIDLLDHAIRSCALIPILLFANIPYRGALKLILGYILSVVLLYVAGAMIGSVVGKYCPYPGALPPELKGLRIMLTPILRLGSDTFLLLGFMILIRKGVFLDTLFARLRSIRCLA